MSKREKGEERRKEKTGYHVYALQQVQTEKFAKLVEKVLREEYYLVR